MASYTELPQGCAAHVAVLDPTHAKPTPEAQSTDELVPLVGQKTVDYLNRIRGLSDPTDIENWHKFCKMHENKKLRDWYAHKVQYPWLLPGYNESLSSFPNGYWQQPIVESSDILVLPRALYIFLMIRPFAKRSSSVKGVSRSLSRQTL
ncbi:hypothetical protein B0H10DRAFT_2242536 [Mycena sp. CBHHK59/15]|nr:hypothetical protein B0H10DRAFT_2242536 [Mycena sp. CBHHK59/15]